MCRKNLSLKTVLHNYTAFILIVFTGEGYLVKAFKTAFPDNLMQKMMWASASSIVFMVRADMSVVKDEQLKCLRDHVDGDSKHIIRLAEKDVHVGGKRYKYFVMQGTSGGTFPRRHTHAETALNLFEANIVPMYGLKRPGIDYDILQVRSCARGVTGQNVFRMSAPASNMVMVYGLGGIGMTTMGGNALLMKALMDTRQKFSQGTISVQEFKNTLQQSSFGPIRHWNYPNPFNQNFAQFVDYVNDPKVIFHKLGLEKKASIGSLLTRAKQGLPVVKRLLRI